MTAPTGGPAPDGTTWAPPSPQWLLSELEILRSNYDQVSRYSERADRTIAQQAARIAELESMLGPEAVQIHGKYRIVLAELHHERERSRRLRDALGEIGEAIGDLHPGDLVEPVGEATP